MIASPVPGRSVIHSGLFSESNSPFSRNTGRTYDDEAEATCPKLNVSLCTAARCGGIKRDNHLTVTSIAATKVSRTSNTGT